jgi:hypothetical protein
MRKRHCCDGLCQQGRHCPAFAPGVIESHKPTLGQRLVRTWRALWQWLGEPTAW